MIRRVIAVVLLAVALPTVVGGAGAAPDFASLQVQPYQPPKPAPPFALPGLDGELKHLADLKGKVVLVFFWTTWWLDCREELPSVNRIYQELKGQGLEVLLVNFREEPDHMRQVAHERGYVAPVLLDESGDVAGKGYGVWGPPTAYFIDREGRLIGRVAGPRDWSGAAARAFIQALLDGR